MRYQTMEQLTELRLSPMRKEYQRQCELPAYQDLSFDDRFAEIVTAQSNNRHEARLKRLVKNADLSDPTALLADIDYDPVFILSAFGHEACMKGMTVRSFRTTRLLTDLAIGRGDGSYDKLLRDLSKPDLLILDDFGLKEITVDLSQDLLEMIDDRWRHKKSVGISSQLPVKEWPNVFADLTICDSIMDRTVRNAYRINLKGPSRRPSLPFSETLPSEES